MATIQRRIGAFHDEDVQVSLTLDDATLVVSAIFYQNLTSQPAYLDVVPNDGSATTRFVLDANVPSTTLNIPANRRPSLSAVQVNMGWPI